MKAPLALIAVLLVLQNGSVSANLNASEIFSDLFDATFNSTGFSVEAVISEPLSTHQACANELNSSIRKDIADAGADFRQALRIQQTVAQENFENISQLHTEFLANINNCTQKESYDCYFSAIQKVVRAFQAQTDNFFPVDYVKIFFRTEELFKSVHGEYVKFGVCLLRHPEVTSAPEKGSSDSSEAEETTSPLNLLQFF
ncbi:uncharacterized protein LOC125777015 isoform X2 [Bactrocera dorsalis]|uniref:Uncharacterized protein LOC125777015 isoform X2 n=1 Tax=Bactrocera dorsalis TaxID=27457 RepID=A0ABM3JBY6_BACDO|nr:uncharacterized protein LOC125777015 isoform X2 [Bactrocera dorsalis]